MSKNSAVDVAYGDWTSDAIKFKRKKGRLIQYQLYRTLSWTISRDACNKKYMIVRRVLLINFYTWYLQNLRYIYGITPVSRLAVLNTP